MATLNLRCGTGVSSFIIHSASSSSYPKTVTATTSTAYTGFAQTATDAYVSDVKLKSGYQNPYIYSSTTGTSWYVSSDKYISLSGRTSRTAEVAAEEIPQETYTIHFNDSPGIQSFTYTTNGGSTVHSATTPCTITFGTTKGYMNFKSITLKSGYSYPITATADVGTSSWTVQTSSSSFTDSQVSCVDVSGKTSNIRNVTLSASQNWYGLDMDTDEGVSSFKGYTVSQGSGTEGSYTSIYRTSSSSSEKFYFTDITPKTGYTYPIYATDGSSTWVVKSSSSSWNDHYVSYSSTSGQYRQVSLYATKIVTYYYRREYSANGGTYLNNPRDLSSQNTTSNPASIGINVSSLYIPYRTDYTFNGYYLYLKNSGSSTETYIGSTDADDTSFSVTFNYTGTQASPNYIQLYAKWTEMPKYTYQISFNANRGSGAPSPVSQGPTTSTACQLIIPETVPTRSGYAFKGWALNSTTSSPIVAQPGDRYNLYSSNPQITLYAQWDQLFYCRLAYDLDGGSLLGSPLDPYLGPVRSRVGSGTYTETILPVVPTKLNHTFIDWTNVRGIVAADHWDPGDTITINCTSTSETTPTTTTIYANWEAVAQKYWGRMAFHYNYGSDTIHYGTTYGVESITAGGYKKVTLNYQPTRTGYTFKNYNTKSDGSGDTYKYNAEYDMACNSRDENNPTNNHLYAQWTANKYTITFNANGGTPTPTPKRDDYDSSFSLTAYSNGVSKQYHTCIGWDTNPDATTPTYGPNATYTIKGDATLYAIWEQTTFVVQFNPSGGSPVPTPKTGSYGDTFSLSTYSNGVKKAGYQIIGWATTSGATTPHYGPNDTYRITKDITLYAVWQKTAQKFYWHGSDTADAGYFEKNDLVESALTYRNWNALKAKISEIKQLQTGSTWSYTPVEAYDDIGASEFNDVRSAISGLTGHGPLPTAKREGDQVLTTQFNGSSSLKGAINTAIDNL